MPVYEYWCRRCEKPFTEILHVAEHDARTPACPACQKSDHVERKLSTFTAITSRKSAAY
jgi:putative FmdB family regulatory protein